jgi:hypothetical protein
MMFMGAMIWGTALWFAYDGYIAWPAEEERYQQLVVLTADIVPEGQKPKEKNPEVKRAWEGYAAEHDLKSKVPKNRTDGALAFQRRTAGIACGLGILFTFWVVLQHRKSVRAEGEVIIGAEGQRITFDEIIEVDRSKWEKKFIAYAIYERDGKRRRLCLDDHKFVGAETIILEAEKRLGITYDDPSKPAERTESAQ